jgi:hypothetical protein
MLLRCKMCNVLIGVRPPFDDGSVDQECLCLDCARERLDGQAPVAGPQDKPKHGDK